MVSEQEAISGSGFAFQSFAFVDADVIWNAKVQSILWVWGSLRIDGKSADYAELFQRTAYFFSILSLNHEIKPKKNLNPLRVNAQYQGSTKNLGGGKFALRQWIQIWGGGGSA